MRASFVLRYLFPVLAHWSCGRGLLCCALVRRLFPLSSCVLVLSSCTGTLLSHHRLSGCQSGFSREVAYHARVKDVYNFFEVDFVGPFKWDLLMRLPGFCVLCPGGF